MDTVSVPDTRKPGRPRSFDRDVALDQAMLCFWRHGYETTSVSDLTAAMGIMPPSLYAAFGDKKQLFLAAAHRYAGDPAVLRDGMAAAPTARQAIHTLLESAAKAFTGKSTPRGCLLASATASGSTASADVQDAIAEIRRGVAATIVSRIEQDVAAGRLPAETNAVALADLVLAIVQGMSVLARDGVSRRRLLAVARQAMALWPA